jgi:RNA polymerase sigma factor (TIGR02999 family)
MAGPDSDITRLVHAAARDPDAEAQLYELVCVELRKVAKSRLKEESPDHSVQTTELIDDAFQKVVGKAVLENRTHFYRVAARAMRQVLIDRARKRNRRIEKQLDDGGLDPNEIAAQPADEIIALDEALRRFQELDPRAAEIVQMRFFGEYTIEQTAQFLDISVGTVKNDWNAAKAWLMRELSDES